MSGYGRRLDKKADEDGGANGNHPFANLEKTAVLQEARYTRALVNFGNSWLIFLITFHLL